MGGGMQGTNEWEGGTEKDAFSKKNCYIQEMKTNNVWGKKRSAADCSTKQNRMAFCPFCGVKQNWKKWLLCNNQLS
jgi:hypothetical protein